jgi:hypothetical protein
MAMASSMSAASLPSLYAVAVLPSPVLNTPDFASVFGARDGKSLRLDRSGLVREVEFVALPGTVFNIEEILKYGDHAVYRVTTGEYPYPSKTGYFVDSRFVRTSEIPPSPQSKFLPKKRKVIERLLSAKGSRYVWGGNYREGVPQLLIFYPPAKGVTLSTATMEMWQLRGVDCSGLLYQATDGYTPRNTSSLIGYGKGVPIAGLQAEGIVSRVEPLDLIVRSGHVMIILDKRSVIESRLDPKGGEGVVVRPLKEALVELLRVRAPLDDYREEANGKKGFVIRRWYPDVIPSWNQNEY